jgi:hypothetical protein
MKDPKGVFVPSTVQPTVEDTKIAFYKRDKSTPDFHYPIKCWEEQQKEGYKVVAVEIKEVYNSEDIKEE